MAYLTDHFMDLEDHNLQRRLTRFLEKQYPSDHACRLAQDINCDPRTAKNILARHWPSAKHMQAIVRRFGRDVIEAVFSPEIEPVAARLALEVRELEEALERKRAHRRQVEGGLPGGASGLAQDRGGPQEITRRAS